MANDVVIQSFSQNNFLVELSGMFNFICCTWSPFPYYNLDCIQVGSNSMQGAGAPTMFHAMRRIVDSLMHQSMGEGALERAINSSFLGNICVSRGSSSSTKY